VAELAKSKQHLQIMTKAASEKWQLLQMAKK